MTVRAEIVTVRCKRLPQSTQCVTSGRYVRLIVCWYSFFFLMTFPCSLALFATLLSILSPHVGREYCPHGSRSPARLTTTIDINICILVYCLCHELIVFYV